MDGEVWEEIGDAYNGKDYYKDQQYNEIEMTMSWNMPGTLK